MSYTNIINGRLLFTYSFELEKIGDEIQRLWRTDIKNNVKKDLEIKELGRITQKGLEIAFESFYQFNQKKTEEMYKLRDKARQEAMKLTKFDKHTIRFARHIIKIIEDATDLSHLTLMLKL